MKAILVMEMPENCNECPLEMDVVDTNGKQWKGNICRGCGGRNPDRDKKPDWCPLVSMPNKREGTPQYGTYYSIGFNIGWNACLDEVEGSKG